MQSSPDCVVSLSENKRYLSNLSLENVVLRSGKMICKLKQNQK